MKDALAQGSVNLRDTDASRSACRILALAPAAPLALPMDGAAEPPRRRRRLAYEAASSSTQRLSAVLQRSAPLSAAHAVEDRFN